jgi:methionyl-tRNA formyltransferase
MKRASQTYTALFAALIASAITLNTAEPRPNQRHAYPEGEIVKVLDSDVTVSDSTGAVAIADLSSTSQKTIKAGLFCIQNPRDAQKKGDPIKSSRLGKIR